MVTANPAGTVVAVTGIGEPVAVATTVFTVTVAAMSAGTPLLFRATLCVALVTFSALSVVTSAPLMVPAVVGVKSIAYRHVAPLASVPAVLDDVVNFGQVVVVPSEKSVEMLGFVPEPGTGKLRLALPILSMVTDCGLSVLRDPTGSVARNSTVGAVLRFNSTAMLP